MVESQHALALGLHQLLVGQGLSKKIKIKKADFDPLLEVIRAWKQPNAEALQKILLKMANESR